MTNDYRLHRLECEIYLREYRAKRLKAQLAQERARDDKEVVPSVRLVQLLRQAMKETVRHE